ncbi:Uncharacterised protein [Salmonella bongori]|nr:Uncharacterised protein [Salmonella bongori]
MVILISAEKSVPSTLAIFLIWLNISSSLLSNALVLGHCAKRRHT